MHIDKITQALSYAIYEKTTNLYCSNYPDECWNCGRPGPVGPSDDLPSVYELAYLDSVIDIMLPKLLNNNNNNNKPITLSEDIYNNTTALYNYLFQPNFSRNDNLKPYKLHTNKPTSVDYINMVDKMLSKIRFEIRKRAIKKLQTSKTNENKINIEKELSIEIYNKVVELYFHLFPEKYSKYEQLKPLDLFHKGPSHLIELSMVKKILLPKIIDEIYRKDLEVRNGQVVKEASFVWGYTDNYLILPDLECRYSVYGKKLKPEDEKNVKIVQAKKVRVYNHISDCGSNIHGSLICGNCETVYVWYSGSGRDITRFGAFCPKCLCFNKFKHADIINEVNKNIPIGVS